MWECTFCGLDHSGSKPFNYGKDWGGGGGGGEKEAGVYKEVTGATMKVDRTNRSRMLTLNHSRAKNCVFWPISKTWNPKEFIWVF